MQHKRGSVGEVLRDYVSAAENVTEWGRSKKADIARLQAPGLADLQATKLTVQFGKVNLQRKSPWRAHTQGLEAPPRLGAHLLAWCIGCTSPNFWPFRSEVARGSCR